MKNVWILSNDLFTRLIKKLDEHNIDYDMYIGTVVDDNGEFISVCIEVNSKNYCKDRVS